VEYEPDSWQGYEGGDDGAKSNEAAKTGTKQRPVMLKDSFEVLVVGK
jgi:hypothetical protein